MRAHELLEDAGLVALGLYDPARDRLHTRTPGDARKPGITLRQLNRLKRIRNVRRKAQEKRQELVRVMYADPDLAQQTREQERELEYDRRQYELERLKDEISKIVDQAQVDQEGRDHVKDMAQQAIERARKP